VPKLVQIGQTVFDIMIFFIFKDSGRLPSWIGLGHIWTTDKGYLVVLITVRNLVAKH